MSIIDPANTTMGDLVGEALKASGRLAIGSTALAEDLNTGWAYLQMMLQQWERKRFLIYRLEDFSVVSTGAQSYTVGPGGQVNTGAASFRPVKIKSAFCRQVNVTPAIDFPLQIIESRQDYNQIRLKTLGTSLPSAIFYDPSWPLGAIYPWPLPNAAMYEVHVTFPTQLPFKFASQADVFSIPYEYYWAILTNLAMALRARFGIKTWPGDVLPGQAKESLRTLRKANAAIALLRMPPEVTRGGGSSYNIFSDQFG